MAVISVNLTDTFEQWRTKTNSLSTQQGDLTTLTTTAKNTVVAAINELDGAASFSNVVEDTSPQLGGNLDVLARSITTSTTNGNIAITPHGSGKVILDGISHPNADGTNGQVLQTNGSGVLSFATISSDPTMGGDLSGTASNAQLVANCVTATELAGDAVTGAQLADDACNSEHYTDGSIDLVHMSANSVDSDQYVDGSVDNVHLATGIDAAKLTTGTLPMARLSGTLPALNGSALTNLDAADVSGTHTSFRSTGIDDNADALAMTIDVSENILIGQTTHTRGKLDIKLPDSTNTGDYHHRTGIRLSSYCGTVNEIGPSIELTTSGNAEFLMGLQNVSQAGTQNADVFFRIKDNTSDTGMEEFMRVKPNQNVGIGNSNPSEKLYVGGNIYATGNITAYSDERIKTNIKELDNTLNAIQNIRGVSYTRTDTKDNSIGVMAQDVETMFPELICEDHSGMKSVNYNGLVGVLFSAVKELSATVKQLKERNN